MESNKTRYSRKQFVVWGLGILSSVTVLKAVFKKDKKKETVKMLTEDGKLVEIDATLLSAKKRKITNSELQAWVKK